MTNEVLIGSTANSQAGARLKIAANGVWGGTFEKTYFDVRVFNPHAPSNRHTNPQSAYRKHEQIKKRAYEQRIREVEHATFSPLVLSYFYKRLASMLASKWDQTYSNTLDWLCCCLAFSLIRSSIQAIRGTRSLRGQPSKCPRWSTLSILNLISPSCKQLLYISSFHLPLFYFILLYFILLYMIYYHSNK